MTKNLLSLRSFAREIITLLLVAVSLVVSTIPVFAAPPSSNLSQTPKTLELTVKAEQNSALPYGTFPIASWGDPAWKIHIPITAYSSEPEQTDDTPFITASGAHVRDGIVAANFLPIGTKVRIPELYGDKEFVVEDRMNARYTHRMDIWMSETPEARKFGLKHATIEVFPRSN